MDVSYERKYILTQEAADDIKRSIDRMVGKQLVEYGFERAPIDIISEDEWSTADLNYISVRVK